MRRNVSRLLIAATFALGIPRLAGAQTAPIPNAQVPIVETPPGLVPQPSPAPAPFPGAAPYPAPYAAPYFAPSPYFEPAPYAAPAPFPNCDVEGDKPPRGCHVEKKYRRGMIIAGSIVLGVMYTIAALSASAQDTDHSPSGWLYLPVAGPWIALGKLDSYDEAACDRQAGDKTCPSKSGARTGYTILGLGELTGFILATVGIAFPYTQFAPDAVANNGITVVPLYAGGVPSGFAVAGRF